MLKVFIVIIVNVTYRLEQQLVKVLDIAFTWKAVLLLDEADIYLEKRSKSDLGRNAMTGIFLRQLEYYQGKKESFLSLYYFAFFLLIYLCFSLCFSFQASSS